MPPNLSGVWFHLTRGHIDSKGEGCGADYIAAGVETGSKVLRGIMEVEDVEVVDAPVFARNIVAARGTNWSCRIEGQDPRKRGSAQVLVWVYWCESLHSLYVGNAGRDHAQFGTGGSFACLPPMPR